MRGIPVWLAGSRGTARSAGASRRQLHTSSHARRRHRLARV